MLSILSARRQRFCDGISRRDFLRVGALGVGGLTLADLLRLRAHGAARSHKAVIMVLLRGGPSHIDTYDPKPDAPPEIRGPFKPIATNVAGVQVSELLPLQAKIMDQLAIVRNLRFGKDQHSAVELLTGQADNGTLHEPAFGAVVSRLSARDRHLPSYVSLLEGITQREAPEDPSYMGLAHKPFPADPNGKMNGDPGGPQILRLAAGMTLERLEDRKALLSALDGLRQEVDDARGTLRGMDDLTRRALEIISSDKARAAFDISLEADRLRDRYGRGNTGLLLARRLVEAGVSMVTVGCSITAASDQTAYWDIHGGGAGTVEKAMPILAGNLDRGVHALLTDLRERGLERDVAVVVWGEMGRTPRINKGGGRDHWPAAAFALLAGGGLRTGQVVGATTPRGEAPAGRPYTPKDVLATLYRLLDIDPGAVTLPDFNGRPRYLLDDYRTIGELL
jgi:hypothetical protein